VAIDGCQVGCAKAILEQAGIETKNYIVLTDDPEIEKNKDFRDEIDQVKFTVKGLPLAEGATAVSGAGGRSSCP
jgi:uncharacterized metal-binding protein